jgi:hypothetical protein
MIRLYPLPPTIFFPPNPFQSSKGRPPRVRIGPGSHRQGRRTPKNPEPRRRRRRHTRTRPHTNDARDKHARLAHVFFRASSASARRRYVRATRLDAPNDRRSMTTTTTARLARRPSALDADEHARRRATRRSSETDSERGIFTHRETTRRRARRRASGVPGRRRRRRRRRRRETAVGEERQERKGCDAKVGVGEGV